jgi:DNA-binding CsgD family transcriptional regulator
VLTGRERRLLALAGEGLGERAIAQALFLTPHEVRIGLARAGAKRAAGAETASAPGG